MKIKVALQLSVLLAGLLMVVMFRHVSESGGFKATVNSLFGIDPRNQLTWCAPDVVDVAWTTTDLPEKLKSKSMSDLRSDYCTLKIEAISGIDTDKIAFEMLAESSGATGKHAILEWNRKHGVFRTSGMPFKSLQLTRELLGPGASH